MSGQSQNTPFFTTDWFIGAAKNNPEGLLLLAAGCALLLRQGGMSDPAQVHKTAATRGAPEKTDARGTSGRNIRDGISEAAANAAREAVNTATEYGAGVADSVSDYAGEVRDRSAHIGRQAQSTLQQTITRVVKEQPLAVAIAGLAAGAAVAAAFPISSFEQQTLGDAGEKLTEAANHAGAQFKEATVKAGERLAEIAEERGLNGEGLKDAGRDVASAFGSGFSGEQPPNDLSDRKLGANNLSGPSDRVSPLSDEKRGS